MLEVLLRTSGFGNELNFELRASRLGRGEARR
jgi:hypothetical protein